MDHSFSINKKNEIYIGSKNHPNYKILKSQYTKYRDEVKILIKNSRKKYVKKIVDTRQCNSRAVWECMKDICGNSKHSKLEMKHINHEGIHIQDEKEMANVFNKHYNSIGKITLIILNFHKILWTSL